MAGSTNGKRGAWKCYLVLYVMDALKDGWNAINESNNQLDATITAY